MKVYRYNIVYKYQIDLIGGIQEVNMPIGSRILKCKYLNNRISIWVLFSSSQENELSIRRFIVLGTGDKHDLSNGDLEYVDSLIVNNGNYVFHVFELDQKRAR